MKIKFAATKERKVILIAGALLLVLAIIYRFYPDLQTLFSAQAEIARKQRRLSNYQQIVEEGKAIEERIAASRRVLRQAETQLIDTKTQALAAAEVQNLINSIAAASQAEIKTMRVLKTEDMKTENYVGIPVQVTLNSSTRQLVEVLYGIETGRKILSIKDMKIRYQRARKGVGGIQTTMTVMGIMKRETK